MLQLVGTNLAERHKCLNAEINSTVNMRTAINEQGTLSDAEMLLNIGIASKNNDIHFILNVLKSGNELYISKALKSVFVYNTEHSNFINPDYLAANIFPSVSLKMRRKILKAISSAHLQDERAEHFFDYCMKNQLLNNATKFFISTSDAFKLKFINNEFEYSNKTEFWTTLFPVTRCSRRDILKFICGNSFELAEAFLKNDYQKYGDNMLHDFRYLYFVSDQKYLDLLEKYARLEGIQFEIGLRISKDITIKHKDRILRQPHLYANKLRSEMLIKHSSPEEIKIYLAALLPDSPELYWRRVQSLQCFYNAFPVEERFGIMKDIFLKKYPGQEFNETESFVIMSTEKRRAWALNKIKIEKDLPEEDKDFQWYIYLDIDTALEIVKEELPRIQNCFKRRAILLNIVECCRTPEDIVKLLQYYSENHKNDFVIDRERFIHKVIEYHDKIFEYEDNVWTLLLNLLFDEDLLSLETFHPFNFKVIITLYHMLHNKALTFSFEEQYTRWHTWKNYIDRLNKEQKNKVFHGLLQFHTNKLIELERKTYDSIVENEAHKYVSFVLELFHYYKRTRTDIPEIVIKFAKLDWDFFCDREPFLYHEADFNKKLKENVDLVKPSDDLKDAVITNSKPRFRLIKFIRNLKIYFSNHDITKDYIKFFKECMVEHPNLGPGSNNDLVHFAVLGIFLLGTPVEINTLMLEHVPTEPKIRTGVLSTAVEFNLLSVIRKAISRLAYRASFESDTLKNLMKYVTGGYLHYYLKTLPSHAVRLPLPSCLQLLKTLLKCFEFKSREIVLRPLFYSLNEADLQVVATRLWDSIRSARDRFELYTALLFYIRRRKDVNKQIKLYNDLLKPITLTLDDMDCKLITETFYVPDSDDERDIALVPEGLRGLHIKTIWEAIMSSTNTLLDLKYMVIRTMAKNISIVEKEVVEEIVDDFVKDITEKRLFSRRVFDITEKWELLTTYLIYYTATVEDINKGLLLACNVINELIYESRSDDDGGKYFIRNFVDNLCTASFTVIRQTHSQANQLLDRVGDLLKSIQTPYLSAEIKLAIVVNTLIDSYNSKLKDVECDVEVVCRDTQQVLASEVNAVVEELIAKQGYETYKNEYNHMLVAILEFVLLSISDTLYEKAIKDLRWYDLVLFFCKGLVNFEKLVTHMLALRLLPRYSIEPRREEYEELLERIETFEDIEVRTLLNKNFSGSKRRRLETAAAV